MKKLVAKVGEYTNNNGETKGRYTNIGVLMTGSDGGEYMLLDPTVNIAGVFALQSAMNAKNGKQDSDRVMVSVWEENSQQQGQGATQQQGYQQNTQQAPQQQQGYQAPQSNQYQGGNGYQQNG